jgi:hypothetical protein
MANQYVNKVIYGNDTLIDISGDTLTADKLLTGYTAHDRSGSPIVGECDFDSDTTDADATASEILATKTAYVNKNKITGEMPNRGAVTGTISSVSTPYTIPNGYHDGSGTVDLDATSKQNLQAGNIRQGVTVLGVVGSYAGESVPTQAKTATPYTTQQVILPDSGYNLSQVTVNATKYVRTDNAAGGVTVQIGDVAPV